ncbi:type II toxin-antitoxin system VapC family toxin [Pyrolobus fumarii]|uniref:type II toxin-antitoxin system VapC family toxin n=1 Tax=Pyrolobus fumarii TaxID=54252 RepID=UPI001FCA56C0|nr:type II toxin-antitoxin system VapC family toxin [Pyrolobus fumarii]
MDTNVVVSYVNRRDPLHEAAERLVARLRSRGLVASQLVVLELFAVYSRVMKVNDIELEAIVEYSLATLGARVEQVECVKLFAEAQRYAHVLRLRTLDLLHVVSAYLLGAEGIATFDRDIVAKSTTIEETLGLRVYTSPQPSNRS